MSDLDTTDMDPSQAFLDTCVLFDYVDGVSDPTRTFFDRHVTVRKVTCPRVRREFESVSSRHQDIHRELLEYAADGDLDAYEPTKGTDHSNDISYVIDLYNQLLDLDDKVEVVRRVNELVNRLEKAESELFADEGLVRVVTVDGLDAQLKGLLSSIVDNQADVRILCDAVAWRRDGGSGTFLSADADDILGDGDLGGDVDTESPASEETGSDGLPDSFAEFFATEEKPLPDRINDRIESRYGSESTLTILSVAALLERLEAGELAD